MKPVVSIILPTYNEAENIAPMCGKLFALGIPGLEVIVADDHSPDGTAEAAERFAAETKLPVRVVRHEGPRGLSPSVVCGFDGSKAEILVCMDADGQHRPEDLPSVLKAVREGAALAVGSRHVPGGGFTERWNWFRSLASSAAALAAKVCLGIGLRDPMSGFFALRRADWESIRGHMSPEGFKVMLEIAFLLKLRGNAEIVECPIQFAMREKGKSKLSDKVVFQYLAMLLRCLFSRGRISKAMRSSR